MNKELPINRTARGAWSLQNGRTISRAMF